MPTSSPLTVFVTGIADAPDRGDALIAAADLAVEAVLDALDAFDGNPDCSICGAPTAGYIALYPNLEVPEVIALSGEFCEACAAGIRGFEALVRAGDVGAAVRYIVDAPKAGGRSGGAHAPDSFENAGKSWGIAFVEVGPGSFKTTPRH
jgi:hypothetical protein